MHPILLVSQVSPTAQIFFFGLVFFGMIGILFWTVVIGYYVYAFLFYAIFGFLKFVYDTVKF